MRLLRVARRLQSDHQYGSYMDSSGFNMECMWGDLLWVVLGTGTDGA